MPSVCWWFVLLIIQNMVQQNKAETRFCGGSKSCVCTGDELCTLQCNGKDTCKGSDMLLGCRPGYPCNVICNSAGEENACEDALIDGSQATDLTVACHDKQACMNARVKCGIDNCNVICISTDSTGSNCDGLTLNCGAGNCAIQCDLGPNICSNINVLGTESSRSFKCIDNTNECRYVDAKVAPFTSSTIAPTISTSSPTLRPSSKPTNSPSLNPTHSTKSPTNRPTFNPTDRPSVFPTVSPTLRPTAKPTAPPTTKRPTFNTKAPSVSPTKLIPTPYPSRKPTNRPTPKPTTKKPTHSPIVAGSPTRAPLPTPVPSKYIPIDIEESTITPTKQIYYVVGEITNAPTKYHNNIYVQKDPIDTNKMKDLVMQNKLYAAIGAGVTACCLLLLCIKCCGCGRKSVAKPAKYAPAPKANKSVFPSPKPALICVKSISGASSRANRSMNKNEFIQMRPPPPDGSGHNEAGMEGIEADVALPGTMGIIGPGGGFIMDNVPRRTHMRVNAGFEKLNDEHVEDDNDEDDNDDKEMKDEMDQDTDETDETEDLGDLNHYRRVLKNNNVRATAGSYAGSAKISISQISHMHSSEISDDPDIEYMDDRAIRQ